MVRPNMPGKTPAAGAGDLAAVSTDEGKTPSVCRAAGGLIHLISSKQHATLNLA
jgi:hypothetical protein